MLVDSNEGMEYMDRARGLLSSLSVAETSNFARLDIERNASLSKALLKTIVANSCLLVLTACLLGLIHYHGQVLEQEAAHSRQVLAVRDMHLEKLTSALSNKPAPRLVPSRRVSACCCRTTGDFYHDRATNMLSR